MGLCTALTLLKVILFLASYPSFSGRLGHYHISAGCSQIRIEMEHSLSVKKKKIYKKVQFYALYEFRTFYKIMFELLFKVFFLLKD